MNEDMSGSSKGHIPRPPIAMGGQRSSETHAEHLASIDLSPED